MTTILEEWNRRLLTREQTGTPSDLILHSWTRSHAAGLDPASGQLRVRRIPHRELNELLAENARLVEVTKPHLDALTLATPVPHVAYLACRDGVILLSAGDDETQLRDLGLTPGYDWSEGTMGTNGAGTALADGHPDFLLRVIHTAAAIEADLRSNGRG